MSGELRIILASASPRRRDLLDLIGIQHQIRPADVDETYGAGENPPDHAERLAREKAEAIARTNQHAVVIGADTIVVIDGDVLGKPADEAAAAAMLSRLSGRTHVVFTGVAVAAEGRTVSAVERVEVTFAALSDRDIRRYIDTREPMDKAGAYGIQGYGATIVRAINGDFFAVMGLSLVTLVQLLRQLGFVYEFGRLSRITDGKLSSAEGN